MTTKKEMSSNRKTAIIVGVLFIIGTVAGFLALFVFAGPILEDPDYLVEFSANENQIVVAALLVLVLVCLIRYKPMHVPA